MEIIGAKLRILEGKYASYSSVLRTSGLTGASASGAEYLYTGAFQKATESVELAA